MWLRVSRDEMILNNLKLVCTVTNRYKFEDAYNEGIIGLIKAVDTYKGDKGYTFSTYAYKTIENHIKNHIREMYRYKRKSNTTSMSIESKAKTIEQHTIAETLQDDYDSSYTDTKLDIAQAISRLKAKDKVLCEYILTKTVEEMAEIYGITRQAVSLRIKTLRAKLKKEMEK